MILKTISRIIANQVGMDEKEITLESVFKEDLGIDSLDIFEIIMELEEEYAIEIPTEDLEGMNKVSDLVKYLENKLGELTQENIVRE